MGRRISSRIAEQHRVPALLGRVPTSIPDRIAACNVLATRPDGFVCALAQQARRPDEFMARWREAFAGK